MSVDLLQYSLSYWLNKAFWFAKGSAMLINEIEMHQTKNVYGLPRN